MRKNRMALALAMAYPFVLSAQQADSNIPRMDGGVVTVVGKSPTSLPTQIPATMEGITAQQIAHNINATDSEDALKYFPSLLVRKRYMGDYNHAILSSRASGTGNSARSAVYADGILLSNYLGNGVGGLSFPPRWGMVTPEEIERVDVMYGPFSAAYPGNSVGAVVDYTTRMPEKLEGTAKVAYVRQPFDLYSTHATYGGVQTSASLGSRAGDWSWFFNFNHTDSQGQPLTFATRLVNPTAGSAGTVVSGAVPGLNSANQAWSILGTGTQYHSMQDHLKAKVAYDFSSSVRATYTLGVWQNTSEGRPQSYLSAAGQPVYSGAVNVNGRPYTGTTGNYTALTGGDFPLTNEQLTHTLHGVSVKSRTLGVFDWEVAASLYDYGSDTKRQNAASNPLPGAQTGGAGTIADGSGTGWNNLAVRGTWRPQGPKGEHVVDFGAQQDSYTYRYRTSTITGNWLTDGAGSLASEVGGRTRLQSVYAQDTWRFAPQWRAVLGLRSENWTASQGLTDIVGTTRYTQNYAARQENFWSPKAALSKQISEDAFVKYAVGRAVRMPTVAELYGATSTTNSQYINDPNLRPEKSWTQELSYEKTLDKTQWRVTAFAEDTQDGIYSQKLDASPTLSVTRVQNVGRVQTRGLENAFTWQDLGWTGLDLTGSVTYADSIIKANEGYVTTPGDTIGKMQPNIPQWRATLLAGYRWNAAWSSSVAVRYSGQQFRTLNNADVNGYAYMGVSPYTTVDVRTRWQINPQLVAAFGIDNLNNDKYWNFHPYPQRSYMAELKAHF